MNVFAAKYSPDGNLIAVSQADGNLYIHSAQKGEKLHQIKVPTVDRVMPQGAYDPKQLLQDEGHEEPACPFKISSDHSITSFAWKKPTGILNARALSLKAVTSDGQILSWSAENPNELRSLYTSGHNYYHTVDYSHDGGQKFVCAGYLPVLEIYDDQTMTPV